MIEGTFLLPQRHEKQILEKGLTFKLVEGLPLEMRGVMM